MRYTLAAAIVLALICSGCGVMQESFQKNFDKSFKESCRDGAMKKGNVSQKIADKYCDCALAKFKETKSMDEASKACVAAVKSDLQNQ
jgi:hypothetical protein